MTRRTELFLASGGALVAEVDGARQTVSFYYEGPEMDDALVVTEGATLRWACSILELLHEARGERNRPQSFDDGPRDA